MMRRILSILLALGALTIAGTAHAQQGVVSIDNVSHTDGDDYLKGGYAHVVSINYDYRTCVGGNLWGGSNGFEIYSPDGADWGYLQGTAGPSITAAIPFGHGNPITFQKHFNYDGATWTATGNDGLDPAMAGVAGGYYLGTLSPMGLLGATSGVTNDIAVILEFTTNIADNGLTLCVDTCNQICMWEWSSGGQEFPVWDNGLGTDGPRCWELCVRQNSPPYWCFGNSDMVMAGVCQEVSYQLCAMGYDNCPSPGPVDGYYLEPPYDDGNYGSVDPSSGLWTWSGPTLLPGSYEIEFRAYNHEGEAPDPFILYATITGDGCECVGRVGDANCSGDDEPTIGDISYMIDRKFIMLYPPAPFCSLPEADINQSGNPSDLTEQDITIGDISILIDYLFITGPELGLNNCF